MKNHLRIRAGVFTVPATGLILIAAFGLRALTQTPSPGSNTDQKKATTIMHATGTFEVKISPLELHHKIEGDTRGRMSIDKQIHGDLEATTAGEMLTAMTGVKGSAGYVAIERVTGSLGGRKGTFVFQHTGTMARGEQQLSVTVVPDSGTGELAGLTGKMAINIVDGKHFYDFEYTLPENH
jgi:Protein of unknown function (DUF3224)